MLYERRHSQVKLDPNEIKECVEPYIKELIAMALAQAAKSDVNVVLVIDKSQVNARYSKVQSLLDAGITIYVDYHPAIAHNTVMVIDGKVVETGSYNFTASAEYRNAENMLRNKFANLYLN